jgi:hypothetical protein
MSKGNFKPNKNYRDGSFIVLITGQAKNKVKMENIRDLLKRFYDTKVMRTFRLFPIFNK